MGILVFLQACTGIGVAPVANRSEVKEPTPTTTQRSTKSQAKATSNSTSKDKSGYHIVTKGDTLYSIAWRYNFDYKEIASWNQINSPYTIFPDQFIRLKPVPKKKGTPLKSETVTKKTPAKAPLEKTPKPVQKKTVVAAKKPETKLQSKPDLPKGPVKWSWPTKGKLVKSKSPTSKKGVDISGSLGQTIKAAAGGEVVYSGSGLLGYGKLIIIKHNETYLSAYAYNSKLLVKEGDRVTAGQQISEMGKDHTGHSVLHFEIRQNGKPVSPIKYLPKKRV
ncbi:MAG: peptidoglycan DD-metalloendopeptidase family protein [Proteobacteria bacterium]|nr:peptidoglycan DD-metalloendopeptidase family protein [Pseudomonadota bacterium]